MEKLYYDRENKKFYVKELNIENNVITDEQFVDVTDEIVTLIQEHVTKDGKKVICLDTTSTIEQEQSFKSLCPQLKQEWSEEDENIIKNLIELVEAQPAKDFHESSKDTILKRLKSLRPSWKPSKEQVEALEDTMTYIPEFYKPKSNLASLLRDLKKQM